MRQRHLSATLKGQKRAVAKKPNRLKPRGQTKEIVLGSGVTVFDEIGEWTGMMVMNNPIPNKAAVIWILPPIDDPAISI